MDDLYARVRELGGTVTVDRGFPRADHNFTDSEDRKRLFDLIRRDVLRL